MTKGKQCSLSQQRQTESKSRLHPKLREEKPAIRLLNQGINPFI